MNAVAWEGEMEGGGLPRCRDTLWVQVFCFAAATFFAKPFCLVFAILTAVSGLPGFLFPLLVVVLKSIYPPFSFFFVFVCSGLGVFLPFVFFVQRTFAY